VKPHIKLIYYNGIKSWAAFASRIAYRPNIICPIRDWDGSDVDAKNEVFMRLLAKQRRKELRQRDQQLIEECRLQLIAQHNSKTTEK
jgi:hypothetical protein